MKSKIQIVVVVTMTVLFGATGISAAAQNAFGKHRPGTGQLPISVPQEIIGSTCPGTNPCAK